MFRIAATAIAVVVPVAVLVAMGNRKPFAKKLYLSREIQRAYAEYRGKPTYYFYKPKGVRCHSGIVVRGKRVDSKDDAESKIEDLPAMMIHLSLLKSEWVVRCNETQWAPPDADAVRTAEHVWDMGTSLDVCLEAACSFKYYNVLTHNCQTFRDHFLRKLLLSKRKAVSGQRWTAEGIDKIASLYQVQLVIDEDAAHRKMFAENAPRPVIDYVCN
jgi:hypothetical protein